ncbi:MAG: hypothetical protein CVV19_04285 [Gammaproteobacteria bacterium HGW-Gammaproteobacteria-9]|nr:MAG: hypothetical protein CVV19_04285 [Gammaproteobacteria bacterium HGW-Gammaproteobacteria-9]
MAFLALGINHKTASVDVRERVAFTPDQMVEALRQLCRVTPTREAAILSTCNRSELYLQQDQVEADAVLVWLANYHRLSLEELKACAYVHVDDQAVRHMMRVASGLDSLVLGEPQILGQMKSAYAVAREAGSVGPLLGRLFQAGENPVSVAFAAVSLARQIFSNLQRSQALLIGAGETITLVARHLHEQGVKKIVVANRTLERASALAAELGAQAILLADIPDELHNSDIVISSTASQLPILGKGAVEQALKRRKHKPMFMVDIAVPRDIESQVGELDDVYLYTVDDLHEVVAENLKSRQGAAQAAEELVAAGTEDFMQRLRELAAVDVLKAYRQHAERIRDDELSKAQRLLANGASAEDVLAQLARGRRGAEHGPGTLRPARGHGKTMKASLLNKLDILQDRFEELTALLGDAEVISDQTRFRAYSREYAEVEPVIVAYRQLCKVQQDLEGAQALLKDSDPDLREMAEEEVAEAKTQLETLEANLQRMLLPKDPNDGRNVFLEIRAGTGGDEAAIFAGDLFRMYSRYAEKQGWRVEILSESEGEHGGYKEVISRVEGDNVYAKLKFESGAHRVQRVPETESQGRIHTSACTVAVLPEPDEQAAVEINPAELRIDTYRSSGAGGQHVNKTDSAIRITHLPTGIVVECQEERSQHKNRAKAMAWLAAKLQDRQDAAAHKEISETRKLLVGSGDRSERIRTYNFPQGRVTDHRVNLTLYSLNEVIAGSVEQVIEPLLQEYQADQLAALGD